MPTPLLSEVSEARRRLCAASSLALAGCAARGPNQPQRRAGIWDSDSLHRLRRELDDAIAAGRIPGAVVWIERAGRSLSVAAGARATHPQREPISEDTVYDVASLTKPVVATLALQQLDLGRLDIDEPVRKRLPEWAGHHATTLRHLLTHTSGLPSGLPLAPRWEGYAPAIALACGAQATHSPGEVFRYSDVNFMLLGEIVQRAADASLQDLAQRLLLAPLGMRSSGFQPLQRIAASRIAPTQIAADGTLLRGLVHDPTARRMGGIAGHAGLFASAEDIARFARMWIGLPPQLLEQRTMALARRPAQPSVGSLPLRGLGWDIDSSYSRARGSRFPRGRSFGHTGFTGCAMWIDPEHEAFCVLLSNRVHPHGGESIVALYESVATAAAEATGI